MSRNSNYLEKLQNIKKGLFTILIFLILLVQVPTLHAGTETILSASEANYPPFCIIGEDNQADGFSVELLRATLHAMGKNVSFETGSWDEVKKDLIDKKIQVLPLVGRTPEREEQFDFTFPYMVMHGTIVVRNDNVNIESLNDLTEKHIAVMKGDNAEEFISREKINARVETTENFETALLKLSRGECDAVIIQKLLARQLINKYQIKNLKTVAPPLKNFVQSFCFAVAKGDAKLLSLLNEGLSIVMADGTFATLQKKWFSILAPSSKSRIIIGGDYNYPPYEYLDKNGQPTGYNVELTRAIAKHLGIDVDIQLASWAETRNKLYNNEIDLIQGMFYSAERDKTIDFTTAHAVVNHVAVGRKEAKLVDNIEDLVGKVVVVMNGDIMHELALSVGLEKQLILVDTQQEALQMVSNGTADYALLAKVPALYWIKKEHITNLYVGHKTMVSLEYCYASLPENRLLLERFSAGLTDLEAEGEYREISQKWLGVYDESNTRENTVKYALIIFIPLLALLLLSILWARTLRKKVDARTEDLRLEAIRFKESEERFRTLVNTIPDLIWLKDTDGVFLACNRMFERLLGADETTILGKTDYDFVDKELADSFREFDKIAMQKGAPSYNEEWVTFADDGSRALLDTTKVPLFDSSNHLIGILGVARNITKRKQIEEQRLALEEQLRQKSKIEAIGLLAGGMAHNFNNNLSIILGNLELLNFCISGNPEAVEYVKNAKTGVERSRELIQQIMSYSRTGKRTKEPISLRDITNETLNLLKATVPSTVFIQYQPLSDDERAIIHASATSMQELLLNLCNNALHAMNDKGILTISMDHVEVRQKDIPYQFPFCFPGRFVRLCVKDTGSGIKKDLLDRIFDPFFTTKGVNEGTGMGLSTAHGIIKEMGGMIKVTSVLGQGTTFEIFFPLRNETPVVETEKPKESQLKGNERILIVDDDQMIAEIEDKMLTANGYKVTTMTDSFLALKLFKDNPEHFDLVMTDLAMPILTGNELIKEILKINPDFPTIICTGNSNKIDPDEIKWFGVKALLVKPVSLEELLRTVRQVLNGEMSKT